jgi:hypothetical protein
MLRTVLAVISGYITIAVLVFFTDVILGLAMRTSREVFAIVNMITAVPYAAAGGYLAARVSEGNERLATSGLCVFGIAIGVAALILDPGHQSVLYSAALLMLFAIGVLAGGYLRMRQTNKLVR